MQKNSRFQKLPNNLHQNHSSTYPLQRTNHPEKRNVFRGRVERHIESACTYS